MEQDSVRPVDTLSLVALYIRMMFDTECLAHGSAFLWRHTGRPFLVSNWHNFSGRNPEIGEQNDNQPKSETGGIPNRVECVLGKRALDSPVKQPLKKGETVPWDAFSFPLRNDANEPLYLEHPLGSRVDIAALPVELPSQVLPFYLNEFPYFEDIPLKAGQDVFIVGYPLGQIAGMPLPIWKRASIASEPYAPIGGLNKLFVDTASRAGMSGSFVIAQYNEAFTPPGRTTIFGGARKLLGIYSGRIAPSAIEAQLGIVWHRQEIDQTVQKGQLAKI